MPVVYFSSILKNSDERKMMKIVAVFNDLWWVNTIPGSRTLWLFYNNSDCCKGLCNNYQEVGGLRN